MPSKPARSRMQARSLATRDRIERAALAAFAEAGFEAASTREIARRAGVKQQQIGYHYGSKLELWKAAVDRLFGEFQDRVQARAAALEGADEATATRFLLREFILHSAERPEIARLMMYEARRTGPRFDWLFDRHVRRYMRAMHKRIARAQEMGLAAPGDPVHLLYVLMGSASPLGNTAEAELLTEGRSRDPAYLAEYVDLVLRLVLPGVPSPPE